MTQESLHCDIAIIGAGPAGLSAAIKLKQLNPDYHICLLEKGAEVGAHILSGAILEPSALNELFPDWKTRGAPVSTEAVQDDFLYLTSTKSFKLPTPKTMKNEGNYIIRLSLFCKWLSQEAEKLGVEIYPGFAAVEAIFSEDNKIIGVKTGDMGIDKNHEKTSRYQPGILLYAKHILLAEGCRGSLSQKIIAHYQLDLDKVNSDKLNKSDKKISPQTYGLGIKELWEISPEQHQLGKVVHTVGWPLDQQTYGGSFIYHLENNQLAIGFVVGLDYQNSYLDIFEEFQRFKLHPKIKPLFKNAKRIGYGARSLCEGGYQSLPRLDFPGGLLIGDSAGFLNVPKIKGIHMAMKSGMVAAETLHQEDRENQGNFSHYQTNLEKTWLWEELYAARNIRPGFKWGLIPGLLLAVIDTYLFSGKAPWTLRHKCPDYATLKTAKNSQPINYPKPDNIITFDKLSSLYLSNIHHDHNQPVHLILKNPNPDLVTYDAPEQRYCPAKVYEIHQEKLQINSQNCLHCKACDIKDPFQNIIWTPPEGGSGPDFSGL